MENRHSDTFIYEGTTRLVARYKSAGNLFRPPTTEAGFICNRTQWDETGRIHLTWSRHCTARLMHTSRAAWKGGGRIGLAGVLQVKIVGHQQSCGGARDRIQSCTKEQGTRTAEGLWVKSDELWQSCVGTSHSPPDVVFPIAPFFTFLYPF